MSGSDLLHSVVVYMVLVALLLAFQDWLLFRPCRTVLPSPRSLGFPRFRLAHLGTTDGLRLGFWMAAPGPGQPVILYFHGAQDSIKDRAFLLDDYAARGWGVVLAEYRGWCGNPGRPSEAGLRRDALAYAEWIAASWPAHPLVVWGESLGTGIALGVAATRPVLGVVLDSPYTSILDVAERIYFWAPIRGVLRHPFRSLPLVARVEAPVMVVHGLADRLIPAAMGRRIHAAAPNPGPMLLLPGVAHTVAFRDQSGMGRRGIADFLSNLYQPPHIAKAA